MCAPSSGYRTVSGNALPAALDAAPTETAATTAAIAHAVTIAAARAARGGNARKTKEAEFMHITRRATFAAILAMVTVACVACQKPGGPVNGQMTILITGDSGNRSFNPGNVSVPLGTIVTWINQDSQPHTVTVPSVFDSGPIPPNGGRWSWVASVAGTFTYHSLIQPDMNGTITVTVPAPTSY
jgi:plastocyanin